MVGLLACQNIQNRYQYILDKYNFHCCEISKSIKVALFGSTVKLASVRLKPDTKSHRIRQTLFTLQCPAWSMCITSLLPPWCRVWVEGSLASWKMVVCLKLIDQNCRRVVNICDSLIGRCWPTQEGKCPSLRRGRTNNGIEEAY